jgi:tetratricopeptide (TPR) repeat protein
MKPSVLKSGLVIAGMVSALILNTWIANAQAPAAGQDLKAAQLLTRSEAYDRAAEIYKQLIQKEPGNSKYYFFYGENWLQDYFSDTISNALPNFTKEAKVLFEKGVTANPAEPLNYIGLARVAFFNGDNKTADEMRAKAKSFLLPYKNIKKMTPPAKDYAYILAKLAESYITVTFKVDTSKALPLLKEAVKIDSKNPDIYLILGDVYNLKNDGSNAIKNYNLAQEYDPTSPTANMKIGSIYVRAKNLNAAIPYFEQAISLNANYAPAYRELGALFSMARRYEDAKKYFEKYLELTQGNIPAKISYVRSLYFAGEYDQVIKNIEDIFKVDQSKAYLNRLAGYSAYEKKDADYDMALRYMEALFAQVSPELIIKRDYLYLAKILIRKNQGYPKMIQERDRLELNLTNARTAYNTANAATKPKLKPNVDTLNARLTRINMQIATADKEIDRGFGEYMKALSFDPEDQSLINEIANNYYTYKRYSDAAKMWSKLIALGKNDVTDYMKIGRAYYVGENYKSADSVFNVVTKMQPDYLPAYVNIANTYVKMEGDPKKGMARPKFEKVLSVASQDSIKNANEISDACQYLAFHYVLNENYNKTRAYYSRMINLDPNNKEIKTKGYNGLAQLDARLASGEKTSEGRLAYIAKAKENLNKILAYDPENEVAKKSMAWILEFEKQIIAGINPNELKGTVRNTSGQAIPNASVRIKDTAAETYTNSLGAFKFEIPQASEALVVSAPGYKTKEIPITRPLKATIIVLEQ